MRGAGTIGLGLLVGLLFAARASAQPPPHYASVRGEEAFLREGPTYSHRILWVYRHKGYPLEVLDSYDTWRRVRDADGTIGWVSATMLSDRRTVLVTSRTPAPIRSDAAPKSATVALAEPGVVANLKACKPEACKVSSDGVEGWIDKNKIWGVGAGEVFQ